VVLLARRYGFLTEQQVKVLKLRSSGFSLRQVAEVLNTSHQNVATIEKRAYENIEKARETLLVYKIISSPVKIVVKENTRLIDVPRIVIDEADRVNIRVRGDFTLIYKLMRFKTPECIEGQRVVKPVLILIDNNGFIDIYDYSKIRDLVEDLEKI